MSGYSVHYTQLYADTKSGDEMSKKDYAAIAEIIESNRGDGVEYTLDNIANELALYFEQDNSTFDRNKFMVACGCTD